MPERKRVLLLLSLVFLLASLILACGDSSSSETSAGDEQSPDLQVTTYTVQAGDTLAKIAKTHDVTVEELIEWNQIENADVIEVGQVLTVSGSLDQAADSSPIEPVNIITTDEGEEIPVPGNAFMDGRDLEAKPALTVMTINIWDQVPRQQAVCKLQHGDSVQILDAKHYASENRYYFKVRKGLCEGWLSEPFLSAEQHEPVGDKM